MVERIPPETLEKNAASTQKRHFDGIICFGGEDFWYHNRGHYDIQMMRNLSRTVPVLYVNSIGMRVPRLGEGRVFISRLLKKVRSIGKGFQRITPRFSVFSPLMLPGNLGRKLSFGFIGFQTSWVLGRLGIENPLIWVACPPALEIIHRLSSVGLVYQRTDRFEEYPNVDRSLIREYDIRLKRKADLTLFCSSAVLEEEATECNRAEFVDHGVDYEKFAGTGRVPGPEPEDLVNLPKPRVGFIGAIDGHTFDPELFNQVVRKLPEIQFVLVGRSTLHEGWCPFPNVAQLGMKPYEQVANYMAACDVLIMPWRRSEWIRACNPVKLKEYLAVGRPIVTTPFDELQRYQGYVHVAHNADEFVSQIERSLAHPDDPEFLRRRVCDETWQTKCRTVLERLEEAGLEPVDSGESTM